MFRYTIRRTLFAVPTLLVISFIIFALLDLAPGDPTSQLPLNIPAEVRQKIREQLCVDCPMILRYGAWLEQFFINEPLNLMEQWFGWTFGDGDRLRVVSWSTRSPVVDLIIERLPQTLWVVGMAYVVGILIALPIGVISAYKQYSWFDNCGTFVTMIGFSIPPFFSGVLVSVIFAVGLGWFPTVYQTNHEVVDWDSFVFQINQMFLPVMVLALQITAQFTRYMRASTLDNLNQDYVRTARAKGLSERVVVQLHVVRNSLIPIVTLIALAVPNIFGGAIITEVIFRVNGIGELLISGIQAGDMPLVQTLTFIFAVLVVLFNLVADIVYALVDPRIRYD